MKRGLYILVFLIFLVSASAELNATFFEGGCGSGFTDVLHLSNLTDAHVELPSQSNYNFFLCVKDSFGGAVIGNSSGEVFVKLNQFSDSHLAVPATNVSAYGVSSFISADVGNISCQVELGTGSCSVGVCLLTLGFVDSVESNFHAGSCSLPYDRTVCCSLTGLPDGDGDGIPDAIDNVEGSESNVTTGISNLNITVGGNSTNGSVIGVKEVIIYDGPTIISNFTHNFSAGRLNLNNWTITKSSTSVLINLNGQLLENETKTVLISDNSFISLCVKDAEITSIGQISTGCSGVNEISFTSCLGGNAFISGINCTDLGSVIRFDFLNHTGILGAQAVATPSSKGGGGASFSCIADWSCGEWSECVNDLRTRVCVDSNDCKDVKTVGSRTFPVTIIGSKPIDLQSCVTSTKVVESTCFDGVRNQRETDVDCGGPCLPCVLTKPVAPFVPVPGQLPASLSDAFSALSFILYIASIVLALIASVMFVIKKK